MNIENINLIEFVAKGFEELKDEVVFLGGMVTFIYADDASLSDIRPKKMSIALLRFILKWFILI
ncbi:hypothetical protein ACE193_19170 [Bernardetia sp. OM2101]|uniref:hypothetical protein n=1 Tax=Bernardetia sp. OM2101 TaxID=3344876 RepID=UPI0035D02FF3